MMKMKVNFFSLSLSAVILTWKVAMARLGLYQLGLASPEYLPLLKFAISSETISDSCILLLLDWARPWKFLETLQRWINVINSILESVSKEGLSTETNWSKGKAILDELKEKCKIE